MRQDPQHEFMRMTDTSDDIALFAFVAVLLVGGGAAFFSYIV